MANSNKDRIFVAIYTRPDTSTTSTTSRTSSTPSTCAATPATYTWGIYIEPKPPSLSPHHTNTSPGTSIDVDDDLSVPYLMYSFDNIQFHVREHKCPPENMLGRIMIGKLPPGRTRKEVAMVLRRVPLPSHAAAKIGDTVGWTRAAVEELQLEGFAERFEVGRFMEEAGRFAVEWQKKAAKEPVKVNYTWSRTFP